SLNRSCHTPPTPTLTLFPYTTLFRSCLNHRREQHRFTKLLRFLRNDSDGRSSCFSLCDTGEKSYDTDRQACCQNQKTCGHRNIRSEEHTSELQSRFALVCRLLLEKKN